VRLGVVKPHRDGPVSNHDAADSNLPCHFGAPFTCHIDHKGAGFAPRFNGSF